MNSRSLLYMVLFGINVWVCNALEILFSAFYGEKLGHGMNRKWLNERIIALWNVLFGGLSGVE